MNGGKLGRLGRNRIEDLAYYYDNLKKYVENVNQLLYRYVGGQQRISEFIKHLGGSGKIHGCIVDVERPNELEGFKFLFCPRTEEKIEEYGFSFNASGDDSESIKKAFFNSKPLWNDYSELLKTINIMEKNDG